MLGAEDPDVKKLSASNLHSRTKKTQRSENGKVEIKKPRGKKFLRLRPSILLGPGAGPTPKHRRRARVLAKHFQFREYGGGRPFLKCKFHSPPKKNSLHKVA